MKIARMPFAWLKLLFSLDREAALPLDPRIDEMLRAPDPHAGRRRAAKLARRRARNVALAADGHLGRVGESERERLARRRSRGQAREAARRDRAWSARGAA